MLTYGNNQATKTTTLNDIPVGTVFEGELVGTLAPNYIYKGVWLRTGPYDGNPIMVIGLTMKNLNAPPHAPVFHECVQVKNYRPLKDPKIVEG